MAGPVDPLRSTGAKHASRRAELVAPGDASAVNAACSFVFLEPCPIHRELRRDPVGALTDAIADAARAALGALFRDHSHDGFYCGSLVTTRTPFRRGRPMEHLAESRRDEQ